MGGADSVMMPGALNKLASLLVYFRSLLIKMLGKLYEGWGAVESRISETCLGLGIVVFY